MRKHDTVLITGASGGLGLEFAKLYARKKHNLVLVARNEGKLCALKNELEIRYGVTVTAFCPGPTATGFEQAASMENGSAMFKKAGSAEKVAKAGYRALQRGKTLSYCGGFTKRMSILCRLVPRSVARKFAASMDA